MVSAARVPHYLTAGLLWLWLGSSQAATLTAEVDRRELTTDEYVILTLTLDQSDIALRTDGVNPNVDLTRLSPAFNVGTPRVEQRYDSHRPQGRAFSQLRVELFPQQQGPLLIPRFEVDGAASQAIEILVRPSTLPAPLAFTEFRTSKSSVYVHEQLVVSLDVFYRTELESAQLGGDLSTAPKPVELIDVYTLPASEREEVRHGFHYKVRRRAWALFPEDAGELTLLHPDIWIATERQERIHLPAGKKAVTVQPFPGAFATTGRIGTTQVEIESLPAPSEAMASWRIQVRSRAQENTLPEQLSFKAPRGLILHSAAARVRHEENEDGVLHIADYTLVAQAQRPGQFSLAPIELTYVDPQDLREKAARIAIPPFELRFDSPSNPAATAGTATSGADSEKNQSDTGTYWPLATAFFAALWICTLLLGWRGRWTALARNVHLHVSAPVRPDSKIDARPLQTQLLAVLDARSLGEGIEAFEAQFGACDALRSAVTAVQSHYFSPASERDGSTLERMVAAGIAAAHRLKSQHKTHANSLFDPRKFIPNAAHSTTQDAAQR